MQVMDTDALCASIFPLLLFAGNSVKSLCRIRIKTVLGKIKLYLRQKQVTTLSHSSLLQTYGNTNMISHPPANQFIYKGGNNTTP